MPRYLLAFLVSLLLSSCIYAQDYIYNHYNTENGLAGSSVHSIYQDREGFIWLATQTGVSRFDGTNFRSYTTLDGLADNEIYRIYGDSKGRIWFTGYNTELSYYYKGKIYNSGSDPNLKGIIRDVVHDLKESGDTIYLAASHIYKIFPGIQILNIVPVYNFYALCEAGKGVLTTLDHFGVLRTTRNGITTTLGSVAQQPALIHKGGFVYGSYILMFAGHDLICSRLSEGHLSRVGTYHFPSDIVRLSTDREHKLWISTIGGGAYYYKNFPNGNPEGPLLKGHYVTDVFEDRERNLWFTTVGNGIYLLTSRNAYTYKTQNGLTSNQANTIAADNKGTIYIGFNRGRVNSISPSGIREYVTLDQAYNRVVAMHPDSLGNIWCATDDGLYRISPDHKTTTFRYLQAIKSICDGGKGRLLVGYSSAVYNSSLSDPADMRFFWNQRAISMCRDHNGHVWLGTTHGVFWYNGHSFYDIGKIGGASSPFSWKTVCIREDRRHGLWFATEGNGIIYMQGRSVHILSQKDGLASNICRSIFLDEDDNLWIAGNRGLNKVIIYDRKRFRFLVQKYNTLDGLASDEVNDVYVKNHVVWAATNNGVTTFDEMKMHESPPPVTYITEVKTGFTSVPLDNAQVLPYDRNNLRFSFVGISFFSAGRMRYKYFLKGIDSRWQFTTLNTVEYGALPPGKYKLIVFAKDSKGIQSVKPAYYEFEISPAFWQTRWFLLCMAGLILGLLTLLGYLLIRRIKRREQGKTNLAVKIAQLELQAVRAQINPHFIFNCLNSIQHYIIRHDHISAQRYLSSFAKLIRKTLDFSKSIYIQLDEEIAYLENYLMLENMRFEGRFTYKIAVADDIQPKSITMPSMLLQPHVENAVVHAFPITLQKEGHLLISFEQKKGILICRIEDNGIGRTAAPGKTHASHGMNITGGRIDSLNTIFNPHGALITQEIVDKFDERHEAAGTVVIIKIPVSYDKSSTS